MVARECDRCRDNPGRDFHRCPACRTTPHLQERDCRSPGLARVCLDLPCRVCSWLAPEFVRRSSIMERWDKGCRGAGRVLTGECWRTSRIDPYVIVQCPRPHV